MGFLSGNNSREKSLLESKSLNELTKFIVTFKKLCDP